MATTNNIRDAAKTIADELATIQAQHQHLSEAIQRAENSRTEAKNQYESALGLGDEQGMAEALRDIRKAVADVPRLRSERRGLAGKFGDIEQAYERLVSSAREALVVVDAALSRARNAREESQKNVDHCAGLRSTLNPSSTLRGLDRCF